jgi:hypothetical protein
MATQIMEMIVAPTFKMAVLPVGVLQMAASYSRSSANPVPTRLPTSRPLTGSAAGRFVDYGN